MSEENNKLQKVESAVNIGSVIFSVVLIALQVAGLFMGRPPTKI